MNVTKIHNYVKVLSHVEYMFFVILLKFKLLSIYINFYLIFFFFFYLFRSIKGETGRDLFVQFLIANSCNMLDPRPASQILYGCVGRSMHVIALCLPGKVHCHCVHYFLLPSWWVVRLHTNKTTKLKNFSTLNPNKTFSSIISFLHRLQNQTRGEKEKKKGTSQSHKCIHTISSRAWLKDSLPKPELMNWENFVLS